MTLVATATALPSRVRGRARCSGRSLRHPRRSPRGPGRPRPGRVARRVAHQPRLCSRADNDRCGGTAPRSGPVVVAARRAHARQRAGPRLRADLRHGLGARPRGARRLPRPGVEPAAGGALRHGRGAARRGRPGDGAPEGRAGRHPGRGGHGSLAPGRSGRAGRAVRRPRRARRVDALRVEPVRGRAAGHRALAAPDDLRGAAVDPRARPPPGGGGAEPGRSWSCGWPSRA